MDNSSGRSTAPSIAEPPGLEVDRRRDRLEVPANVECLVRRQVVAEVPPGRLQAGRSVVDDPHGRLAGKPGERVASARRRLPTAVCPCSRSAGGMPPPTPHPASIAAVSDSCRLPPSPDSDLADRRKCLL